MPTRKQRRRRQKELRHEYEYVYVDETGEEVAVEPDEPRRPEKQGARRNGKGQAPKARARGGGSSRPPRKIDPPSWNRVVRRALLFGVAIFFALQVINQKSLASTAVLTVAYTLLFIPFMYLLDRAMYRSYLRRTGELPPRGGGTRGRRPG